MADIRFRPLGTWPYPESHARRRRPFKASWAQTLRLLERELSQLDASAVIIAAGFTERDIRIDGWVRGDARDPAHPGVEISFETVHFHPLAREERVVFATDVCDRWRDNVRSIALGLEALRAVDRYGITRRGEQYAGFKVLPAGTVSASIERGRRLIQEHGGVVAALKATHPDHAGDEEDFIAVRAAQEAGV